MENLRRRSFLARVAGLACAPFGLAAASTKPAAAQIAFPTERCAGQPKDDLSHGGFLVPPEFAKVIASSGFFCLSHTVVGTSGLSLKEVMRKRGVIP